MMPEDMLSASWSSGDASLKAETRLSPGAFTPFLSVAELLDDLEYALVTTDYLTVFRSGTRVPLRRLATSRQVLNKQLHGFVAAAPVKTLYAEGNCLQFNDIDQWKRPVREFIADHASFAGARTLASAFIVPPRTRPMEAHTEGAHLFMLQLDGGQEVLMGDPGEDAAADAAYRDLDGLPTASFALRPGDLLHIPHGWPYRAETAGEASLHLALSVRYPGTELITASLSEFLLEGIESSPAFTSHHRLSPPDKSRMVLSLLAELLTDLDPAEIARHAESR
jgi:ribosomal protein L16 Arg81 hydroxylase